MFSGESDSNPTNRLMHPEREDQWTRHFKATCAALFFYGLWFGEYPYEHITVVDPAWGGRRAGGMEYPTLFTAGTSFLARPDQLQRRQHASGALVIFREEPQPRTEADQDSGEN